MLTMGPWEGGPWAVLDEQDRPLYLGTYRQCEDWLDRRQNLALSPAAMAPPKRATVIGWLRCWFESWHVRRNVDGAPRPRHVQR